MANLEKKSYSELISDINILGDSVDISSLLFHATSLLEKASEKPQEKIIADILNNANSNNTRVILLQINRSLGNSGNNEKLLDLLDQKDIDFEIKRNVLLNFYNDSPNNVSLFEKIANGDDERLAFQATKMLNSVSPEKALEISNSILKQNNGIVTDKMRASINVRAASLNASSSAKERQDFISLCDNILNGGNEIDEVIADSITFTLSDVMSEETISYIVKSDRIDNIAKISCINQNFNVLKSMLSQNPTTDKTNIVLKAMSIYPIIDMIEPLKFIADSKMMSKEIQDTIKYIEKNGVSATNKY